MVNTYYRASLVPTGDKNAEMNLVNSVLPQHFGVRRVGQGSTECFELMDFEDQALFQEEPNGSIKVCSHFPLELGKILHEGDNDIELGGVKFILRIARG